MKIDINNLTNITENHQSDDIGLEISHNLNDDNDELSSIVLNSAPFPNSNPSYLYTITNKTDQNLFDT